MNNLLKRLELKMLNILINFKNKINIKINQFTPKLIYNLKIKNNILLRKICTIQKINNFKYKIILFNNLLLKYVYEAIKESDLDLNTNIIDNNIIITSIPITQDAKKKYIKRIFFIAEEYKIYIRKIRRKIYYEIKEISKNMEKNIKKYINNIIDLYIININDILFYKEKYIINL